MGSRSLYKLNVNKLRTLPPGIHQDGGGLQFVVDENGNRRWTLRLTIRGQRKHKGLGTFPDVTLAAARDDADERRRAAREGRDLDDERAPENPETLREAFEVLLALKKKQLSNAKHLAQWPSTMEQYVFPKLGKRPVADITPRDVLDVMEPIWFVVPETASRVLQRLSSVFEHAILRQTRKHADPTGGVKKALGSDHRKVVHHRALPFDDVPAFVSKLREGEAVSRQCLLFAILTASRSQEARRAEWCEVDMDNRLWTVPAIKMKARRPHAVPLSTAAIELLQKMRKANPKGDLVFPAPVSGGELSDAALTKIVELLEYRDLTTVHGFRSAFKEWATKHGVPRHISEAALAHENKDKVEAAYLRSRFVEERAPVMEAWADFIAANNKRQEKAKKSRAKSGQKSDNG
jgi:integrase